jgi:hypothetical protein
VSPGVVPDDIPAVIASLSPTLANPSPPLSKDFQKWCNDNNRKPKRKEISPLSTDHLRRDPRPRAVKKKK